MQSWHFLHTFLQPFSLSFEKTLKGCSSSFETGCKPVLLFLLLSTFSFCFCHSFCFCFCLCSFFYSLIQVCLVPVCFFSIFAFLPPKSSLSLFYILAFVSCILSVSFLSFFFNLTPLFFICFSFTVPLFTLLIFLLTSASFSHSG